MEQSSRGEAHRHGVARQVTRGIMQALEQGRLVPGQRLVETDLAAQFGVGRNAVREAIQWLTAHGVVDMTRHRSPAIRQFDAAEAGEVLDVAEAVLALAARGAAGDDLTEPLAKLESAPDEPAASRAMRHFYAALVAASGNRELARLLPALGLHIFLAQYRPARMRAERLAELRAVAGASADAAVKAHIAALRKLVQ